MKIEAVAPLAALRQRIRVPRTRLGTILILMCTLSPVILGQAGKRIRVLTYNIHHGEGSDGRFDYDRLIEMIRRLDPDLVALQEVDVKTGRAGGLDQKDLLSWRLGYYAAFGRALYFGGGEYGNAVLSRYPIEEARTFALPFRPGSEPRAALAARVRPVGGLPELVLVSTHLCHLIEQVRTDQTAYLDSLWAGSDIPVILAGDLNARQGSPPIERLLQGNWRDAVARDPQIDHILLRKTDRWRIVGVEVVGDRVVSDHPPILVEIEWLD